MSSVLKRSLTILIAAPLLISLLWAGKQIEEVDLILFLVPILAVVIAFEYSKIANLSGFGVARRPFALACAALCFLSQFPELALIALVVVYGIVLALYIDAVRKRDIHGEPFSLLAWSFGLLYCGLLPATFTRIYSPDEGFLLIIFLLAAVWAFDIGAYVTGKLIGKTKLAWKISPNKTIEGVFGGWILSSIVCVLFAMLFTRELGIDNPPYHGLLIGFVLSIATQSGDLLESQMKRMAGVKDSGNILPGHGGLLDRIDGLLIAAPIFYLYVNYVL